MVGSIVRESSILAYLPDYFDYSNESTDHQNAEGIEAMKQKKRRKVEDKQKQLKSMLIRDCEDIMEVKQDFSDFHLEEN
jgi:hypothetical protein